MSAPARATDIVFTRHAAKRGLGWLREGYRMFSQARMHWLALIVLYYVVMVAVSQIPFAAHVLFALLKPILAVGLLAAAWTQERGGKPTLSHLFQGFKANLRVLIPLGMVFIVGAAAAVVAASAFDGGLLLDVLSGRRKIDAQALSDTAAEGMNADTLIALQRSMLVAMLFALPTILALWFAPGLVVFQDASPSAALGASLRAAVANWRALLVFALAVGVFGALPIIVAQLIFAVFPSQVTVDVLRVAMLAYGLIFAATLHIADYVSYRDVFHAGETLAPLAPASRESPR